MSSNPEVLTYDWIKTGGRPTGLHLKALLDNLRLATATKIDSAIDSGTLIPVDASTLLESSVIGDRLEATCFLNIAAGLINTATKATNGNGRGVSAFTECASLLWMRNQTEAALQLEQLGGQMVESHTVELLCGYELKSFLEEQKQAFCSVGAHHSLVHLG